MNTPATSPYTVAKIKTFRDHDGGTAYDCDLLRDGKKIAEVLEDGWGGGLQMRFVDDAEAIKLAEFCKTLPPHVCSFDDPETGKPNFMEMDSEMFVEELVLTQLEERDRKRALKAIEKKAATHVLFRLKSDGEGYHYIKKMPNHQEVAIRAHIMNKYGSNLASFFKDGAWCPVHVRSTPCVKEA